MRLIRNVVLALALLVTVVAVVQFNVVDLAYAEGGD